MSREKICCVYKIASKTHPDRFYIGSTVDYWNRRRQHIQQLKKGDHHSPILQNHANKYGWDDFDYSIVESFEFQSKEHLIAREQYYIDTLKPTMNAKLIADSSLGLKRSEETKKKVGDGSRGHKMPEHVLKMLVEINTGSHISEEHKKAIGRAQSKPKPYMVERNKGNTYGKANKGKPSPFKGKKGKPTGVVPRSAFKKGNVPWNKGKKMGKQDPKIIEKRVATMKRKREEKERGENNPQ